MNDIPPKQTVNGIPFASPDAGLNTGFNSLPPTGGHGEDMPGALVSVHNAALHANADSFPVLKAFQDYLEAERNSARRRVVMLSVFFVSLMAVVVAGLIIVGIFVFKNMARQQDAAARTQDLLLQTVLQQRNAAATAPAPVDPVAAALQNLGQKLESRLTDVGTSTAHIDRQVTAQNAELDKLKESLSAIQQENEKLRGDMKALQTRKPNTPVTVMTPAPKPTPSSAPLTPLLPVTTGNHPPPALPPTPPAVTVTTVPVATVPVAAVPVAAVPKAPLDLPPDGFRRPPPPDGYAEDVIALPSRVTKDALRWQLLTPIR
jgi:hypothetical protein